MPLHVDGASGGFVWPFLYPDFEWDFRLEQVRSINVSGHKYGLVYPGIGWLIFRETADLAEDLVFYENYLGKTDATFTLNFSTGSAMVLAQYYTFIRFGREGYKRVMEMMQQNARFLAARISEIGPFQLIGDGEPQLPLVAFQLAEDVPYDEFDIAWQVAAERGWMLPAYTMPPNADHVKMLRALVKLNLSHALVHTLADDIAAACETLEKKGGASRGGAPEGQDRGRLLAAKSPPWGDAAPEGPPYVCVATVALRDATPNQGETHEHLRGDPRGRLGPVRRDDDPDRRLPELHLRDRGARRLVVLRRGQPVRDLRRPEHVGLDPPGVGLFQLVAAFSIWNRHAFGRLIGVVSASVSAIAILMFVNAAPWAAFAIFILDLLVIYGLVVYGGRRDQAAA